jgi:deoxyribonuclease I
MDMRRSLLFIGFAVFHLCSCGACSHRRPLSQGGNQKFHSFRKAKIALKQIYLDHRKTIYCGCAFDEHLTIDLKSCSYHPAKPTKRAKRVEWEHIVPAKILGKVSHAWQHGDKRCLSRKGRRYKGRRCAKKIDPEYRRLSSDLYNLFPAVGALNNARGSYPMADIEGEPRKFGDCDFEIEGRRVEPSPFVRGEIARTYLYMNATYPEAGILDAKAQTRFEVWSRQDPPDEWECLRAQRIERIQGNANEFVQQACSP